MQAKSVLKCFQLCLLIGICTAIPLSNSEDDSGSDDDGKIVKLQGKEPADDVGNDGIADESGVNEPVDAEEKDDVSGANQPVDAEDNNNLSGADQPVDAEDKDDVSATNQPVDAEYKDNRSQEDQPVDADDKDNVSGANQPVNAEDKDNVSGENQPVNAEDKDNVSGANQAVDAEDKENVSGYNQPVDVDDNNESGANSPIGAGENTSKAEQIDSPSPNSKKHDDNKAIEDKDSSQQDINGVRPSPTDDNDETKIISEDCKIGGRKCELVVEKLPSAPGFKLSADEMTKFKIWPDAKIPYFIDEFSYDKVLRNKIRARLDDARILGLTFFELPEPPEGDDKRWVFFVNRRGQLDCKDYSTNSFTNKGVQKVIIGYNCLEHGGPMAAIVMALAGVPPQHNAPNRDKFITIKEDHILPKKKGLFKKLSDGEWLFHDLGYDYDSVTHYHAHKYSADGSPTIERNTEAPVQRRREGDGRPGEVLVPITKDSSWTLNNDAKTYSNIDILKVRMLYNYLHGLTDANPYLKGKDCNALYRPGPKFKKLLALNKQKKLIAEYPKPKQYLAAIGNTDMLTSKHNNFEGELLSSLED